METEIKLRRGIFPVVMAVAAVLLAMAPAARADFPSLFAGGVACALQPANGNVRLCSGTTATWDGKTKIDVDVILRRRSVPGPTGPIR